MVRVATNLTNGETGFSVWSQRVERRLDDIFAFQSDIARMVSNALSVRMATDDPAPGGTRNVRAYEAYLRGRALYNLAKDEATDREARANFEVAIAADPKFALAPCGAVAGARLDRRQHAEASELKPLYAAAVAEAQRAIDLAPTLRRGPSRARLCEIRGLSRCPRRPTDLRQGVSNTAAAMPTSSCSMRCTACAHRPFAEARGAIERALALDPLNPRTHRAAGADRLCIAPTMTDAIRRLSASAGAQSGNVQCQCVACGQPDELGRLDEARRGAMPEEPSAMFRLRGLAVLEHRAGNQPAARSGIIATGQRSRRRGDVPAGPGDGAMGPARRGDRPARTGPRWSAIRA